MLLPHDASHVACRLVVLLVVVVAFDTPIAFIVIVIGVVVVCVLRVRVCACVIKKKLDPHTSLLTGFLILAKKRVAKIRRSANS